MWPEYIQFLAFYLITVAALKVGSAWVLHNRPGNPLGNGLAWFVPGLA